MTRRHRAEHQSGFTLVELMVGLAVAALVSLILIHGIGLSAQGLGRLSERAEYLDEQRTLEKIVRRALDAAIAIPVFEGKAGFDGQPTSVRFLSIADDGGPGIYSMVLALDATRQVPIVTLERRLAGPSAASQNNPSVLLRHVQAFSLSYFGAPTPDADPRWHRRWSGIAALPLLVRIMIDTGDGHVQPPIILRPRNAS